MEELPPEITTDILSRMPDFKSIGNCKCVCKLWYSILSDSTVTTHLSKTTPDLLLHFRPLPDLSESRMYYVEDDQALDKKPIRPLKLLDESHIKDIFHHNQPNVMGSCRGFICALCCHRRGTAADRIITNCVYISNPITGQQVKLHPFISHNSYKWFSGFGSDRFDKIKVVIILCYFDPDTHVLGNELRIHTLGSATWRSKYDVIPNNLILSDNGHSSVFLSGSLHWITYKQSMLLNEPRIVSFDLAVEEFSFVPIPELEWSDSNCYKLGLVEDQLSLVECSFHPTAPCINVWVMDKYNVEESWVKKFSIGHDLGYCVTAPKLIKLRKNGELLLQPNDKYMVSYNTATQKWRRLLLGWVGKPKPYVLEVHPIVGSLLSFKEAFGVDPEMKRTTSLKRKR